MLLFYFVLILLGFSASFVVMLGEAWQHVQVGFNDNFNAMVFSVLGSLVLFQIVFILCWGEAILNFFKAMSNDAFWKKYTGYGPGTIRFRRWLYTMFAWAATAYSGFVLFPDDVTLVVVLSIMIFGIATWKLDARLHMASEERFA